MERWLATADGRGLCGQLRVYERRLPCSLLCVLLSDSVSTDCGPQEEEREEKEAGGGGEERASPDEEEDVLPQSPVALGSRCRA